VTDTVASARPLRPWLFWGFIVLMAALTVLFCLLGKWQLDRLAWKEGLIATVAQRMHMSPIPLPPVDEWVGFDAETYEYRPIYATGHFLNDQAVRVFTGLEDAKGRYSGPGYWVMTPFAIDGGGTVFVDRGFVPQAVGVAYANDKSGPQGTVTVTGIGMISEEASAFTPGPDGPNRIEWLRNIDRLKAMTAPPLAPFADVYIDMPAGAPGALPQGGETSIEFPNNHLGYAYTWFGFAIVTPIMLIVWIFRQRRGKPARPATA
jgi:surfeit locus 1 family protein